MQLYLDLLRKTMTEGIDRFNEGSGLVTRSSFGASLRVDLSQGFPLVSTRYTDFQKIVAEMLWCIKGDTNISYLHQYGITRWDNWADKDGFVGPLYGAQWRRWETADDRKIDQLRNLIAQIKFNSTSRRLILSSWNVAFVDHMWVTPSNVIVQFYVQENKLSSQLVQRTTDLYNRLPESVASYSLLTHILAKACNLDVGEFIWVGGDVHIQVKDFDKVTELIECNPHPLPKLQILRDVEDISEYEVEDFDLDYSEAELEPATPSNQDKDFVDDEREFPYVV